MVSKSKVIVTEAAWIDFSEIISGIAEISLSTRSVNKWAAKILNNIKSLAIFADGGKEFPFDNRYRTKKVGKYLIIYQVLHPEDKVYIHRIIFARRDLSKIEIGT